MRDLMFNNECFADEALTWKEPEESLEELLDQYESAVKKYEELRKKLREATEPASGSDKELRMGMAVFNAGEWLEILQDRIDTKICHMNAKEAQQV